MTKSELYRHLRSVLGPWFRQHGFKGVKASRGLLMWGEKSAGPGLVVWCQERSRPWSNAFGSQFTVEFARSESPIDGIIGSDDRERFSQLLSAEKVAEVLERKRLMCEAWLEQFDEQAVERRRRSFEAVEAFLVQSEATEQGPGDDIWLRYRSTEDVHRWAEFVREELPNMVETARRLWDLA